MESVTLTLLHNIPALILGGVLLIRERQNAADRRELLDRIMSADFKEFKRYAGQNHKCTEFPGRMTDEELAIAARKKNNV
jgi:hypothetical protein